MGNSNDVCGLWLFKKRTTLAKMCRGHRSAKTRSQAGGVCAEMLGITVDDLSLRVKNPSMRSAVKTGGTETAGGWRACWSA